MSTATIATISTGGKNVFTPRIKNETVRLSFFISDADMAKVTRGPGLKGVVTDLVTGAKYSVKGASCGSKHCYCDAIAKQVTPTWAEYQMSRATDEVMQAAIKEVAKEMSYRLRPEVREAVRLMADAGQVSQSDIIEEAVRLLAAKKRIAAVKAAE